MAYPPKAGCARAGPVKVQPRHPPPLARLPGWSSEVCGDFLKSRHELGRCTHGTDLFGDGTSPIAETLVVEHSSDSRGDAARFRTGYDGDARAGARGCHPSLTGGPLRNDDQRDTRRQSRQHRASTPWHTTRRQEGSTAARATNVPAFTSSR